MQIQYKIKIEKPKPMGNDVFKPRLTGTTQLWKVLEPRLGPLTDNFWTVSALFSASQSWPNFLVIKDEKYFCLVYGLLSPPIGQDFLSATFVLSWPPRLCSKSVIEYRRLYFESLGHIWKVLENLYRKNVLCVNLGKNPYGAKI